MEKPRLSRNKRGNWGSCGCCSFSRSQAVKSEIDSVRSFFSRWFKGIINQDGRRQRRWHRGHQQLPMLFDTLTQSRDVLWRLKLMCAAAADVKRCVACTTLACCCIYIFRPLRVQSFNALCRFWKIAILVAIPRSCSTTTTGGSRFLKPRITRRVEFGSCGWRGGGREQIAADQNSFRSLSSSSHGGAEPGPQHNFYKLIWSVYD